MSALERILRELERLRKLLMSYGIEAPVEALEEYPPMDVREGALYPLYSVEPLEDYYRFLFDLPGAKPDSIQVYVEGDDLVVEASLEREISIETPWSVERRVVIRKYKRRIPLPPDADPSRMRIRIHPHRKILEVIIPRV